MRAPPADFYDRCECAQIGQQAEGAVVMNWIKADATDDEIIARLSADIEAGHEH